jgi:hypothetical protein
MWTFLCNFLRWLLILLLFFMIIGIALTAFGFVLATIGIIGALIALAASGTPVGISAVLGVSVFGNFIMYGLSLVLLGILIFLGALALYLIVELIIRTLPVACRYPRISDELRCMLAPFLPAGALLILTVPTALFLFLALNKNGLGLNNPGVQTLIIGVVVMLCIIGLLFALVPIIWCCCCKCRKGSGNDNDPIGVVAGDAVVVETT